MPVRVFRVNPSASRRHYKLGLRCVAWRARDSSECGRKVLRPSSHGGRARRAAAEYQPGYDGLPGGAQGPRALRIDIRENACQK